MQPVDFFRSISDFVWEALADQDITISISETTITDLIGLTLKRNAKYHVQFIKRPDERITGADYDLFFIGRGRQYALRIQAKKIQKTKHDTPRWHYPAFDLEQAQDLISRCGHNAFGAQPTPTFLFYNHFDIEAETAPRVDAAGPAWGCAIGFAETIRDAISRAAELKTDARTLLPHCSPWHNLLEPQGNLPLADTVAINMKTKVELYNAGSLPAPAILPKATRLSAELAAIYARGDQKALYRLYEGTLEQDESDIASMAFVDGIAEKFGGIHVEETKASHFRRHANLNGMIIISESESPLGITPTAPEG